MWESTDFPHLSPLAIPHHGGRDIPIGTKRSILIQLEDDLIALEEDIDFEEENAADDEQNAQTTRKKGD